jgi:hypothetical protein
VSTVRLELAILEAIVGGESGIISNGTLAGPGGLAIEEVTVSMIFPGMDPYLEDPQLWPGVHSRFIVYLADHLQPQLRPRYVAAVEERVFVEGPDREIVPDVWLKRNRPHRDESGVALADADSPVVVRVPALEVHETYVAILDRQSGQRVVTVIEVVSPTNKYGGPGRISYLAKQKEVLSSDVHLVEIDLPRTGPHVLAVPEWMARGQGLYDYLVCVNRAHGLRDEFDLYLCQLRDRLPRIRVPLAGTDADVRLDVQTVLTQTFDIGSYRDRVNYDSPCRPPLPPEDQKWANERIHEDRAGA